MSNLQVNRCAVAVAAALLCGATAQAQSLIQTSATSVVASAGLGGDAVPGLPGVNFGGSGDFDTPVIDDNGVIWFRARMVGTGVTTNNERAYFRGTSRADLALVYRAQDLAPGLGGGEILGTATATGIGSSYRLSPDGQVLFNSSISGGASTTANDAVVFGGPIGSVVPIYREGDACPGTVGAIFPSVSVSTQNSALNRNGRVLFTAVPVGGDTTTANNLGLFSGSAGALELVLRKGSDGPGAPGDTVFANIMNAFFSQMNDSGQIVYDAQLSTTLGTAPATTANDRLYHIHTPGSGNVVLVREGDSAPGTAGGTFNINTNTWSLGVGASNFTNDGRVLAHSDLMGGDVVGPSNDRALYFFSTSGHTMVMREGDPAPGTDATFSVVNNNNTVCNSLGKVAFMANVTGGTSTTANDSGLWTGTAGNLQLVVREGDPAPGTVGATMALNISLSNVQINDRGQILFPCDTAGGDTTTANQAARWLWDPITGLKLVARNNDLIEVQPGVFDNVSGVSGGTQFTNTDGRALSFNHDGKLTARFNTNGGRPFVAIIDTCPSVKSICSGDGALIDHTTPCPCGNNGAVGNGCAHSFDPNGANLTYSGSSILDTMVLESSFTPGSAFTLFMQHDAAGDQTFHDGVLCAGGNLIRLRGRNAVIGAASFPNSNFANDQTTTLAQRGLVVPGSGARRYYAAWYRNASTTFCPPATANVTNGLQVDW